jgi:acyl carrier protein
MKVSSNKMTKVFEAIIETVQLVKGDNLQPLDKESLIETLKLDSLDEVEVMMALEERFNIEIDQAMIARCVSLYDLEKIIQSLLDRK